MVDLERLRAAIDRHRRAGETWYRIAESIGTTHRTVTRWHLGGGVDDPRAVEAVERWLARGAPCDAPVGGRRRAGRVIGRAEREGLTVQLRAQLARMRAAGIQAKQIARGIGVHEETVAYWHLGATLTSATAETVALWLDAGCPVPPARHPGRKPGWTPPREYLVAAGALDVSVTRAELKLRLGVTEGRLKRWCERVGLVLPRRPHLGGKPKPKGPASPPSPTPEQLAWLCRPGLPTSQWGLDVGDGVATPSRARACERAGWVEVDGPRSYRLTAEGQRLADAELKRRKLADLGWDAA